jgi:MinD-like ATPase involved in chromosome partitioning or flagellar assembly
MNKDWQDAVLGDLGVGRSGLAIPPPSGPADSATPSDPPRGKDDGPQSPASLNGQAPRWMASMIRQTSGRIELTPADAPSAAASAPPATPAVPADPAAVEPADLVGRPSRGDPLLRRMSRELLRTVGAAASRDVHDRMALAAALQRPVTTGRRIVVASARGGAGKSTMSALIGTVLSYYRQDRVLVIDADPALGSLPMRLGVGAGRTLQDLAQAHPPATFEELQPYLTRTPGGLWLLRGAGGMQAANGAAGSVDAAVYRAMTADLSRFFAVTIVDCGGGLMGGPAPGLLADTHAHVLVTPATADGAFSARGALDWLAAGELGPLIPRTVGVFVGHAPHAGGDPARAAELLRPYGMELINVGYDRHLASGGPIDQNRLAEQTRVGAERIAARALAHAMEGS